MFDIPALTFVRKKALTVIVDDHDDDDDDDALTEVIVFGFWFVFLLWFGWFVRFLTKTLEQEPSSGLALPW